MRSYSTRYFDQEFDLFEGRIIDRELLDSARYRLRDFSGQRINGEVVCYLVNGSTVTTFPEGNRVYPGWINFFSGNLRNLVRAVRFLGLPYDELYVQEIFSHNEISKTLGEAS